jgi:isoprenylcysteine carboxyl methyltransferase (ICMT) family protein YpbQ
MDFANHAAEFVMSLFIASTILIGLSGIFFVQIRIIPDTSVIPSTVVKPLRRVLYISITFGIVVLILCGTWFMTSINIVIYFALAAFLGQIYFFLKPAVTYGRLPR